MRKGNQYLYIDSVGIKEIDGIELYFDSEPVIKN